MNQQIQYCRAPDGARLAYAAIGHGSPVVRTSHWLTHLQYDLESPVWRHVILGFAERHTLIRYDSRGEGLSQGGAPEISFEAWVQDLEAVVEAAGLSRFALFGASQGAATAIAYAARHPERVSRLVIYGGFARGMLRRGDGEAGREQVDLMLEMIRHGWGSDVDAYRQWFTSTFMPEADADQFRWFNQMQRLSATPKVAERHLAISAQIDVVDLLPKVQAPTLVLHARGDLRAPFWLGEEIAAGIPGARFVPLEGANHLFLAGSPAHHGFFEAVYGFLGDGRVRGPLPGAGSPWTRLESGVQRMERNWLVKLALIVGGVTGLVISCVEIWKLLAHAGR